MALKSGGDCYEVHAHYVINHFKENILLCHGTVWHPKTGTHGHAWIEYERGEFCIDIANGMNVVYPKSKYYEQGHIKDVKKYTPKEAAKMMFTTNNYGPWEEAK